MSVTQNQIALLQSSLAEQTRRADMFRQAMIHAQGAYRAVKRELDSVTSRLTSIEIQLHEESERLRLVVSTVHRCAAVVDAANAFVRDVGPAQSYELRSLGVLRDTLAALGVVR